MDNSIIDITGQSFSISNNDDKRNVPYWQHQYVYSFSEIETAGKEQRRFYKTFKANFLNGLFMDIEGNNNYAFILLFDLLKSFETHKDTDCLERQLKELGLNYPRTKSYCVSLLIKKFNEEGKHIEIERIRQEENYYVYDSDHWRLGNVFKLKLNLGNEDITLLNKLYAPSNNFFNIEFCSLEVVKLYLVVIKRLGEKYQKEQSSLTDELTKVADVLVRKHFNYRNGSANYNYAIDAVINELYNNIFKHTENTVRECYGHKRKLNTDLIYVSAHLTAANYDVLLTRSLKMLSIYIPTLANPDRTVEIELNAQNPTRWRVKYEQLISGFNGDCKQFVSDVIILGTWNKKNPALANIFYDAAKFISQKDRESSLKLYVYYLHHDLKSVKFDNKPLTKTVQKSLFSNNQQLHEFQVIVSDMIKDRALDKALNAVSKVYALKRKKIKIDRDVIQQVHEKHSGTVELLNEYLKDEYEDETNTFKTEEINAEEMVMEITSKAADTTVFALSSGISFTPVQSELMDFFVKANLSVPCQDVDAFASSRGMFKNQLIDSLNEVCYDLLDDVLIEEDDEYYIINDNYYQTILAK
ncbi:MAG: hypothetical protein EOO47_02370 [Flavobacterium sp.]|nr:MAG: hypothetical protein EOO47_02370 [Flavobacterium sp.]